ncbi:MAG: TonB-dependent receptor [Salinivirgaceae bacterium]|nr:MAG: TonB-dependent receptor [Salinivirgaceae bacterium]
MKHNRKSNSQNIYYFRKWSRKGFGVFRSQGKQIAISTMIMAGSLTFESKTIFAQTDSAQQNPTIQLDEIMVNGDEEPILFSKIARIVTVLNQNDIAAAPVSNINELLEYAIGVDIRQRGQKGVQADIALRGGTFDQTLVLLNGINITDPQTGHHNLNLPVSLNSISRIEVLSGPSARIFGVNAYNGAINIITTSDTKSEIKILAEAGQFGYLNQHASIRTGEKWNNLLSIDHQQSDGYLPNSKLNNTDFTNSSIFYQLRRKSSANSIDIQTGYNSKAFGANSFYTPAYPEQFEATKTFFSSANYHYTNEILKTGVKTYFRRHLDKFELFRDTAPSWYTSHNYHLTDIAGAAIPISVKTLFGNISANFDLRYEHIYSNVLGKNMAANKKVPGQNAWFTKQDERFHSAFQLNYSYDWEKLHIAAGLMTSHYNTLKRTRTYPGMEISYEFISNTTLYGSYNEALRLPTFTDLYYNGPTNIGNPDLKPEEAQTVEGGIKYVSSILRLQSAVYFRKGENMIEWVKTESSNDLPWQTENLTEINTMGIDFDATFILNNYWKDSYIKTISINYSWIDQQNTQNNLNTKYVGDYLKHQFAIRITHKIYSKIRSTIGFTWQDRNGSYLEFKNNTYGIEKDYNPVTVFNWKLSWEEKYWSFFAQASNLFDQKYFDISNVPQPGRWVQIGVKYVIQNI